MKNLLVNGFAPPFRIGMDARLDGPPEPLYVEESGKRLAGITHMINNSKHKVKESQTFCKKIADIGVMNEKYS